MQGKKSQRWWNNGMNAAQRTFEVLYLILHHVMLPFPDNPITFSDEIRCIERGRPEGLHLGTF